MRTTDGMTECIFAMHVSEMPIRSRFSHGDGRTFKIGHMAVGESIVFYLKHDGLIYISRRDGQEIDYELTVLGTSAAQKEVEKRDKQRCI